ncbi:hypothetical protein A2U01_0030055 [Trifolium medium]|uniref:Uncharacterized protein n=1 Tax=Trifolium medium TaxID=97028 RepID=A0A392PB42_9FABA|nr:hypothetical protein [Trifolium medium]
MDIATVEQRHVALDVLDAYEDRVRHLCGLLVASPEQPVTKKIEQHQSLTHRQQPKKLSNTCNKSTVSDQFFPACNDFSTEILHSLFSS